MNHSFATSKGNLTYERLEDAVCQVRDTYFHGPVKIPVMMLGTCVRVGWEYPCRVDITLRTKRTISLRPDPGDCAGWIPTVLQEGLAKQLHGRCSSEAAIRSWEPTPERYPTFTSYLQHIVEQYQYEEWPFAKDVIEASVRRKMKLLPEELRPFFSAV